MIKKIHAYYQGKGINEINEAVEEAGIKPSQVISICSTIGGCDIFYLETEDEGIEVVNSREENAQYTRLKKFMQDLIDHGLRCDLNPTINLDKMSESYVGYLKRIDRNIRERAESIMGYVGHLKRIDRNIRERAESMGGK